MTLDIKILPMFDDNYGFLVRDTVSGQVATVDPGDPEVILAELQSRQWQLDFIFNTHHHYDHVDGNKTIKDTTGCKIIGPKKDSARIPEIDMGVSEGSLLKLGKHPIDVIETPGHTSGHICFNFVDDKILFVGDTLFAMGCGRLFEGTPSQMWHSLQKIKTLPLDTKIYCAHEYTLKNGNFALTIDPENKSLQDRMAKVIDLRKNGKKTIPTTLGIEEDTNPFLRADKINLPGQDPVIKFSELRQKRDKF